LAQELAGHVVDWDFGEVSPVQRKTFMSLSASLFSVGFATTAVAQAPAQPLFATTKVEGTSAGLFYFGRIRMKACR
jgi:hypothetical protein